MESFFLIILIFLALLAAFDLFVGVSNDAVNFLNSAIGSKVASFRTVMLVASLGVLIGATFSSGMMEIARSGVFNPDMFVFSEIMVIFFAVMVTDVLLLDIFNSFGLPTSTTVSLVFELLGGAVAAAAFKIAQQGDNVIMRIGDYINNEKALAIISGILVSVVVAFIAGAVIQWIVRMLFTFKYEKAYKYGGAAFGGVAVTAIFYYLVMKGANGASFMRREYIDWINNHTLSILIYMFVSLTAVFQLLILFTRVNIFKIVILSGTFALAFAFAGNDLVNFVGVPLAAYDSWLQYEASGVAPDMFTMEGLRNAVQTPTFFLLLAGLIMVLTLFFSKKAHRVVKTSINLSSGSRGAKEQFGSSLLARTIVRSSIKIGNLFGQIVPAGTADLVDSRMEKPKVAKGEIALPFDYVRASINLVVSSILIASATSLKLPLSTTYVTFMVAMGSSLADGAWDRESAVYRVSGVLTVIGGWFLTAFTAFTSCAMMALLVFWGGNWAAFGLMFLVCFVLIRSNFLKKDKAEEKMDELINADKVVICRKVNESVEKYMGRSIELMNSGLNNMLNENLRPLRTDRTNAVALHDEVSKRRGDYYYMAISGSEEKADRDARHYYYRVMTNMKELSHGLQSLIGTTYNHIDNNHYVFKGVLRDNLLELMDDLSSLHEFITTFVKEKGCSDAMMTERQAQSILLINRLQAELLERIEPENLSLRSSEMYLNILQFSRDLVNRYSLMAILSHELVCKVTK